jgi:DNA mismatch endonuclease (patch repair protein)
MLPGRYLLAVRDDSQWVAPAGSWASDEATRNKMLANRSRDTKPELLVRSLLHERGLRYRVNQRPLPGLRRTADIVFRKARVAVFIDGCFWHGCPEHYKQPGTNSEYWSDKVEGNRRRDRETDAWLVEAGWTVLRHWEHDAPEGVADQVEAAVRPAGNPIGSS